MRPERAAAVLAVALLAAVGVAAGAQEARPQRIVSLNLCTDQLLLELVPHERIASVTGMAADPAMSALAAEAAGLPVNHGGAEEVIALDPDLVVAGAFTTRQTVRLLERLGYRVLDVPPAQDFDDIRANIARLGEAVGEGARAKALVAELDAALATYEAADDGARPVLADLGPNLWTSGVGTLVAAVAHAAGYDTLGERLGVTGQRQVSLEQLLVSAPDLFVITTTWNAPPALASDLLRHPALTRLMAARAAVEAPDPQWACGGPWTLDAVARIATARAGGGPAFGDPWAARP